MSDEQERLRAQKAQQLKRITDGFDPVAYGKIMEIIALEKKINYDAYVAAGFTPEQALALCK